MSSWVRSPGGADAKDGICYGGDPAGIAKAGVGAQVGAAPKSLARPLPQSPRGQRTWVLSGQRRHESPNVPLNRLLCGVLHRMRLHGTVLCLHSRECCSEVFVFHIFEILGQR